MTNTILSLVDRLEKRIGEIATYNLAVRPTQTRLNRVFSQSLIRQIAEVAAAEITEGAAPTLRPDDDV